MLKAALGMPGPKSCRHSLGLPSVALPSTGKEMSIDERRVELVAGLRRRCWAQGLC